LAAETHAEASQRPVPPPARALLGSVRDAETGTAVAGAVVMVRGTGLRVTTDPEGRFALQGVAAEPLVVVVRRDGYGSKAFDVTADAADVSLSLSPQGVEEIVVVGRATRIAKENLANSVARLFADDLEDVTSPTLSEALQAKVAGANILANSGAPGGGIQMQLRGVSTINGRSAPLYVIDGVIISDIAIPSGLSAVTASTSGSNSQATQDNQVNRVADINPNDIERIEILKGASAAAIYGVKASNGVVIISTKRGKVGAPRATITQRLGVFTPANKLGSRTFDNLEEALEHNPEAARYYEPGRTYDHEAQLTRQREISSETVVSVSGGTATTDYYASLLVKNDEGVIPGTGYDKHSGRISIGQRFGSRLRLRGTANLIVPLHGLVGHPQLRRLATQTRHLSGEPLRQQRDQSPADSRPDARCRGRLAPHRRPQRHPGDFQHPEPEAGAGRQYGGGPVQSDQRSVLPAGATLRAQRWHAGHHARHQQPQSQPQRRRQPDSRV
jgi:TonB-dependent SusC/RagA subfamily outer membrane receptor